MKLARVFAIAFLATTSFFFEPKSTLGQSRTCTFENAAGVLVNLSRADANVQFNNSLNRNALARLNGGSALRGGWTAVGLTQTELRYRLSVAVEAYQLRNGRYCARLARVNGSIGYDRMDVFIDRRYRPGSCAYNAIAQHELLHVSVFNTALNDFYPRMIQGLEQASARMQPVVVGSPNQGASRLQRAISRAIEPLFKSMQRELKINNARLDTPENYRREQQKCNDW